MPFTFERSGSSGKKKEQWHLFAQAKLPAQESVGTIFAVDAAGRRSVLEHLPVETAPMDESDIEFDRLPFDAAVRFLGLSDAEEASGRVAFELLEDERHAAAHLDAELEPFLDALELRSGEKYLLIREVCSATGVRLQFDAQQMQALGGTHALDQLAIVGVTYSLADDGSCTVEQEFSQRCNVLFLPEEIAIVRSALAGARGVLGRAPVRRTLTWQEPGYAVVQVYYGTDRNSVHGADPAERFGAQRADVSYGTCEVSIPRDHRMGVLESPSIRRFEFREKPEKHVVLLEVDEKQRADFLDDLRHAVDTAQSNRALLFVHGYNVTFEDAARRTAQISYDLGFAGVPMFYSWPSQAKVAAYTIDEANIEWSEPNLRAFVADLLRSDLQHLYVIAHSMGNRGVTRALSRLLAEEPALCEKLTEVVLTAPDIDAAVFRRDLVPALTVGARPITLYVSSGDKALQASHKVHGNARAGDSGAGAIVAQGIETVDASAVDTSFLGHSYVGSSRSVLSDLFQMIRHRHRAHERGLEEIDGPSGRYWAFRA